MSDCDTSSLNARELRLNFRFDLFGLQLAPEGCPGKVRQADAKLCRTVGSRLAVKQRSHSITRQKWCSVEQYDVTSYAEMSIARLQVAYTLNGIIEGVSSRHQRGRSDDPIFTGLGNGPVNAVRSSQGRQRSRSVCAPPQCSKQENRAAQAAHPTRSDRKLFWRRRMDQLDVNRDSNIFSHHRIGMLPTPKSLRLIVVLADCSLYARCREGP